MTAHMDLVCVCNEDEKEWGRGQERTTKPPEGRTCENTHTPTPLSFTTTTTTKLLYFASRVVGSRRQSTSTLLADSRWSE